LPGRCAVFDPLEREITSHVLQRPDWYGAPVRLSMVGTLTKGPRTIQCVLYSHQFGWELRIAYVNTLVRSQVCRSEDDVLATQEQWRGAMQTKDWR
jgi:hypothetical protein